MQSKQKQNPQIKSNPTPILFNPDELRGVKRARLDELKRADLIHETEQKEKSARIFKAMPLPGGGYVHHDLNKKTMAAELKDVNYVNKMNRRQGRNQVSRSAGRERNSRPIRMEASDLFNFLEKPQQQQRGDMMTSLSSKNIDNHLQNNIAPDILKQKQEERKQTRMQMKMEKEAAATRTLQEEIDLLEKKLGKGKHKIIEAVDEAETVQPDFSLGLPPKPVFDSDNDDGGVFDEYLDAIDGVFKDKGKGDSDSDSEEYAAAEFEQLLAKKRQSKMNSMASNLSKHVDEGSNDDSSSINSSDISLSDYDSDNDEMQMKMQPLTIDTQPPLANSVLEQGPGSAVYRRQEKWIKNRDKKRLALVKEKEQKALEGFTGKPQIKTAKDSWEKAKAAHAMAAEKNKQAAELKELEKIAKEEADIRKATREIGGLKSQIRMKKKQRMKGVDLNQQVSERSERALMKMRIRATSKLTYSQFFGSLASPLIH